MYTSTELQLKATLNYTDGKLNIYTYVKIMFYYAILGCSKAKEHISKLFLSAVKLVIRWKLNIL